jgi:prepilin-type N-terminal cleavage/methylation domain-containing protein
MEFRTRYRGFTLVELCVAVVIVLILLSIFIPYLLSVREKSNRTGCDNNLRVIFNGLKAYASANDQAYPRVVYDPSVRADGFVAFTGVDDDNPFQPGGVEPSDATASLFLLVRQKFVEPKFFVCPSGSARADAVADPLKRGNFSGLANLSYSYSMPFSSSPDYRFNSDRLRAEFVLLADRNPGIGEDSDVTAIGRNAKPVDLAKGNSTNHRSAGQNVLYVTGGIVFQTTPYCGYLNDNIYTAQAAKASTQPLDVPADTNGVFSESIGPARPDDSFLVPAGR